jgi:hypothetical protein
MVYLEFVVDLTLFTVNDERLIGKTDQYFCICGRYLRIT